MTGDPIDRTVVQPAADQARDDRSHRRQNLAWTMVVVGVIGLAVWSWFSIHSLSADVATADNDARTATTSAQDAAGRAQQLYDQVVKLGGTPVVAPPPVAPVAGAAGLNGSNGTNGHDGQTPPCLATATQCVGAPGKDGQNGKDGVDGKNGSDGQPGTNGVDGQPGQPGKDGTNGKDGASVTRQYFDRDADGGCRNFNDYSDGRTRVDEGPAGDSACAPAEPPPTTTPSAVLPTGTTLRRRD